MKVVKDYTKDTEMSSIIKSMESQGFRLVEVQTHYDGKHLVFENDEPEISLAELAVRVSDLESKVSKMGVK